MTAAMKGSARSPISVARGGGGKEGGSFTGSPVFSARTAFKSMSTGESRYGKAMSTTPRNPLGREISIGPRPVSRLSVVPHNANPRGLHIPSTTENTITSSLPDFRNTKPLTLGKPKPMDTNGSIREATKAFRGDGYITLFDRSTVKVVNPAVVEAPKTFTPALSLSEPRKMPKDTARFDLLRTQAANAAVAEVVAKKPASTKEVKSTTPMSNIQPETLAMFPKILPTIDSMENTLPPMPDIIPSISPKETERENTLMNLKKQEWAIREASLSQVRSKLQQVRAMPLAPGASTESKKAIPVTPEMPVVVQKTDRRSKPRLVSPLTAMQEKNEKKYMPVSPHKDVEKMIDVITHVDEPQPSDKDQEKQILSQYVNTFLLMNEDTSGSANETKNKEVAKRMVANLVNKENTGPGSQLEAQLLGDTNKLAEQAARKKIEELVTEARVTIQLAKLQGVEPEKAEKKIMLLLHMKIQEAGLFTLFTKIKETVLGDLEKEDLTQVSTEEIQKDSNEGEQNGKKPQPEEQKLKSDEKEKPLKIERDTLATRFRKALWKSRAQRALDRAKERGRVFITEREVADEIGTYQYQFTKSKPVRFTKIPDGSIIESLLELRTLNRTIQSVEQIDKIIDEKVERLAPVRVTEKIRTQRRGLFDLLRVFGATLDITTPKAA